MGVTITAEHAREMEQALGEYDRSLMARVTSADAALAHAFVPEDRDYWQRRRDQAYSRADEVRRERARLAEAIRGSGMEV